MDADAKKTAADATRAALEKLGMAQDESRETTAAASALTTMRLTQALTVAALVAIEGGFSREKFADAAGRVFGGQNVLFTELRANIQRAIESEQNKISVEGTDPAAGLPERP